MARRPRRRRWLVTELRTTPAAWAVAALTAIGVHDLLTGDPDWVGWWQNTVMHVDAYTSIVLGTSAGALAAWEAGRSRARGMHLIELVGRRSGAMVAARPALPIWLLCVAAYVVLLTVGLWRTALVAGGDVPWGLLLLTVALLAAQVAVGSVLGAWLPRVPAVLVTAVLLYGWGVVEVFVPDGEHTWGRLYPIIHLRWDPFATQDLAQIGVAAIWLVAVSALLLLTAGLRHAARRPSVAALVLVPAAAVATAAAVLVPQVPKAGQFSIPRGTQDAVTCIGTSEARACAWSDYAFQLPAMREALVAFRAGNAGLPDLPQTVVAQGMTDFAGDPEHPHARSLEIATTRAIPPRASTVEAIADAMASVPGDCAGTDAQPVAYEEESRLLPVVFAARAGVHLDHGLDAPTEALLRLPRAEQDAWINDALRAMRSCAPVRPVPGS